MIDAEAVMMSGMIAAGMAALGQLPQWLAAHLR